MPFEFKPTGIKDLTVIQPLAFGDERGFFMEVFRTDLFSAAGLPAGFSQWNHSGSVKNVVRGLHFQWDPPMAKMMRVTRGLAFLVAVDIRKNSPTLGRWFGENFSEEDKRMLYAPAGFARGFCVLSEWAEIQYVCTGVYNPKGESGILWDDPEIGIKWPVETPILSEKDAEAQFLSEWLARPESDHFVVE